MSSTIEQYAPPEDDPISKITSTALAGKKAVILGIANDQSIAFGCARAMRKMGAEIAMTYLSEKTQDFRSTFSVKRADTLEYVGCVTHYANSHSRDYV